MSTYTHCADEQTATDGGEAPFGAQKAQVGAKGADCAIQALQCGDGPAVVEISLHGGTDE